VKDLKEVAMVGLTEMAIYEQYLPWAKGFLWVGIQSNLLLCAVLLVLYFQENFATLPWMWRIYAFIVCTASVGSTVVLFYAQFKWDINIMGIWGRSKTKSHVIDRSI